MNKYIFSAKNNAFYPVALRSDYERAGSWPEDGIEVEDKVFKQFSGLSPEGMHRSAGENGLPFWENLSPTTKEEKVETAKNQKKFLINTAIDFINSKQWAGKYSLGRLSDDEIKRYNLWLNYLDTLEEMDIKEDSSIIWPDSPD
ncbi:tail fiber assembly protein [Pantoea stewartii subsp. indologenes]|uniref:tail fiber assembly protein n=1 Tax=Pantoea stewartii TaxID=66269 RepID=UPI001981245E|nr:tail fiber assembly protein [Pantoea stewartii]MDK2633501.1 tail fiber assembly protein [Pantoea stewartii subsp. indologenes]MEB6536144.1 tail fiber assembly protein [Pantoea stewartii]